MHKDLKARRTKPGALERLCRRNEIDIKARVTICWTGGQAVTSEISQGELDCAQKLVVE
jgi:hypothetical protein